MAAGANPWRFLTPLSGDNPLDRELIQATRADEIQVLINLIAASRVSLLYSASGNGKSSLINAGLVPFFNSQGYAVFRTRPRPAWSSWSPVQAFKDSILRNPSLPDLSSARSELLESVRLELAALPEGAAINTQRLFDAIQGPATRWLADDTGRESFIESMKQFAADPIPLYLKRAQDLLGLKSRMLILCDQFEELFVHYANTPALDEFVTQCGEAWADSGLRIHFVFSMREDWVGSMIEFRPCLPDIFRNFYRLKPVRAHAARKAILLPLEKLGLTASAEFVDCLLRDLAVAYSQKQTSHLSEAPLPISPDKDPYVELPALQVVCDKLWRTRHLHNPFTLSHYEALRDSPDNTPLAAVLDGYIDDCLALPEPEKEQQKVAPEVQDLRLDCLFVLTDRSAHRRATMRDRLLQDLRLLRSTELYPNSVTEDQLRTTLAPLVARGLLRREEDVNGQEQYELAHDFAVRSVLAAWAGLERQRTIRLATAHRELEVRSKKFSELARIEELLVQLLRIAPAVGLIALSTVVAYGWYIFRPSTTLESLLSAYLTSSSFLIPMKWIAIVSFATVTATSILRRYLVGALYGGATLLACWLSLARLLPDPTTTQLMLQNQETGTLRPRGPIPLHFASLDFLIFVGIFASSAFVYPQIILKTSRLLEGSPLTQRIALVVWNEFLNLLMFALAIVTGIAIVVGIGVSFKLFERPGDVAEVIAVSLSIVLGFLLYVAFSSWLVYKTGWFTGGPWCGLRVADKYRARPSKMQIFRRQSILAVWCAINAALLLPSILLGPFIVASSEHRTGIYDMLAGTQLEVSAEP